MFDFVILNEKSRPKNHQQISFMSAGFLNIGCLHIRRLPKQQVQFVSRILGLKLGFRSGVKRAGCRILLTSTWPLLTGSVWRIVKF
jgi:hypothetical protein